MLLLLLGDASLEHVVETILHQQLCVLVDCISQPYEAVSRLGCSCIRYADNRYSFVESVDVKLGIAIYRRRDGPKKLQ